MPELPSEKVNNTKMDGFESQSEKPPLRMGEIVWDLSAVGEKREAVGETNEANGRPRGTVKYWNTEKGFGFVVGEDEEEFFVHLSSLQGGRLSNPLPGETVYYDNGAIAEPRNEGEKRSLNRVWTHAGWQEEQVNEQLKLTGKSLNEKAVAEGPERVYVGAWGDIRKVKNRPGSGVVSWSHEDQKYQIEVGGFSEALSGTRPQTIYVPDPIEYRDLYEQVDGDPNHLRPRLSSFAIREGAYRRLEEEHQNSMYMGRLRELISQEDFRSQIEIMADNFLSQDNNPKLNSTHYSGSIVDDDGSYIGVQFEITKAEVDHNQANDTYTAAVNLKAVLRRAMAKLEIPLSTSVSAGGQDIPYSDDPNDIYRGIDTTTNTIELKQEFFGKTIRTTHPVSQVSLELVDSDDQSLSQTIVQHVTVETNSGQKTFSHPVYNRNPKVHGGGLDDRKKVLDPDALVPLVAKVEKISSEYHAQRLLEKLNKTGIEYRWPGKESVKLEVIDHQLVPEGIELSEIERQALAFLSREVRIVLPWTRNGMDQPENTDVSRLPIVSEDLTEKSLVDYVPEAAQTWERGERHNKRMAGEQRKHWDKHWGRLKEIIEELNKITDQEVREKIFAEHPGLRAIGEHATNSSDWMDALRASVLSEIKRITQDYIVQNPNKVRRFLFGRLAELADALKHDRIITHNGNSYDKPEDISSKYDGQLLIDGSTYGIAPMKSQHVVGGTIYLDPVLGLVVDESGEIAIEADELENPEMGKFLGKAVLLDRLGNPLTNPQGRSLESHWYRRAVEYSWGITHDRMMNWRGESETHTETRGGEYTEQILTRPDGVRIQINPHKESTEELWPDETAYRVYIDKLRKDKPDLDGKELADVNAKYSYAARLLYSMDRRHLTDWGAKRDEYEANPASVRQIQNMHGDDWFSQYSEIQSLMLNYGSVHVDSPNTNEHPIHKKLNKLIKQLEEAVHYKLNRDSKLRRGSELGVEFEITTDTNVVVITQDGISREKTTKGNKIRFEEIAPDDAEVVIQKPELPESKNLYLELKSKTADALTPEQIAELVSHLTQSSKWGLLEYGLNRENLESILKHASNHHKAGQLLTVAITRRINEFAPKVVIVYGEDNETDVEIKSALEKTDHTRDQLETLATNLSRRLKKQYFGFQHAPQVEAILENLTDEPSDFDLALVDTLLQRLASAEEYTVAEAWYERQLEPNSDLDDEYDDDEYVFVEKEDIEADSSDLSAEGGLLEVGELLALAQDIAQRGGDTAKIIHRLENGVNPVEQYEIHRQLEALDKQYPSQEAGGQETGGETNPLVERYNQMGKKTVDELLAIVKNKDLKTSDVGEWRYAVSTLLQRGSLGVITLIDSGIEANEIKDAVDTYKKVTKEGNRTDQKAQIAEGVKLAKKAVGKVGGLREALNLDVWKTYYGEVLPSDVVEGVWQELLEQDGEPENLEELVEAQIYSLDFERILEVEAAELADEDNKEDLTQYFKDGWVQLSEDQRPKNKEQLDAYLETKIFEYF